MNEFDNELHEELFKLFILASNDMILGNFTFDVNVQINRFYKFQYSDRVIHEEREEYEECTGKIHLAFAMGGIRPDKNIRFYYVDDNK